MYETELYVRADKYDEWRRIETDLQELELIEKTDVLNKCGIEAKIQRFKAGDQIEYQ
ncbi:Uncharacterised protein [uncultured archaeon]|nr:Uncharacterised protein [uncultured archaeon]